VARDHLYDELPLGYWWRRADGFFSFSARSLARCDLWQSQPGCTMVAQIYSSWLGNLAMVPDGPQPLKQRGPMIEEAIFPEFERLPANTRPDELLKRKWLFTGYAHGNLLPTPYLRLTKSIS